ncbi:hypothetical protein [Qipengyuania sp. MTN3-11]|uniref:hypothetical protein n=1 Tax=Qipengyuania sp. MTN3-11 TaxID=3056557 RepID=UPI0036F2DA9E
MNETRDFAGTTEERQEKASSPILQALKRSEKAFQEWDAVCHGIDDLYSRHGSSYERLIEMAGGREWKDAEMDLFWSSSEVLKPAVYARPPVPAIAPMFKDGGRVKDTTAEVLERAAVSTFKRTGIDDVMHHVRDDLLFSGRGVMWLRYESDDGKKVCVEHLDREDFLHDVARKWSEVGWVAGGFWMSRDELRARFTKLTDEQLGEIKFLERRDETNREQKAMTAKAKVWEVWHRANNRVYWVTDGLDVYLEDDEPHLTLEGFFPCPRPAYGTLRRRSLIPVPDFERYAGMFSKINTLTARIYLLLNQVKLKGLIPGGGDIATTIETALRSDDDTVYIQVPGAAMIDSGGRLVDYLPLDQIATAITGLIEARRQLIEDFYQLSGISDIMRGATEAEETLGAQQMKAQYGSVRVRCKIDELQRIAADAVKIASEIIAEEFDGETLLEMAQMDLPTRQDIEKRINEIETAAEQELEALTKRAEEMAQQAQEPVDPQQAKAMLQQEQQAILAKYAPMLEEAENLVPIDDVMDLLRDDKARSFAFEIETDSTVLTDEIAEKQARNEFMTAFNGATQGLMAIAGMGEAGGKLAGEMLKFSLAPYRVGRQMSAAIDDFVKQAPGMIAAQQGDGSEEGMAALAEAEKMKAQAAMERVQAQREKDQAEASRKIQEMQEKAAQNERDFAAKMAKLQQDADANTIKAQEAIAKVDNLRASTMKLLAEAGIAVDNAALDEFVSLKDIELRERQQASSERNAMVDQARTAERDHVEDGFREQTRQDQLQQQDEAQ